MTSIIDCQRESDVEFFTLQIQRDLNFTVGMHLMHVGGAGLTSLNTKSNSICKEYIELLIVDRRTDGARNGVREWRANLILDLMLTDTEPPR